MSKLTISGKKKLYFPLTIPAGEITCKSTVNRPVVKVTIYSAR